MAHSADKKLVLATLVERGVPYQVEPFPGLEHIERRTERQVTIRPADHLVSLTGRRQHFIAGASSRSPFPV